MKTLVEHRTLSEGTPKLASILAIKINFAVLLALSCLPCFAATDRVVISRGPHHRIVQTASGGTYTELADGLCFLDENGNYADSEELFELVPGSAIERSGAHKATLPANINGGVVELIAPDGKRFLSSVAGLSYFSAASGENILIAQVQNSTVVLHPPNQIIYPASLVGQGVIADVRYTWRKNSFAQDVITRQIQSP